MTPEPPRVLGGVMAAMLTQVVPHLSDPYAIQTASLGAMLAAYAAQEFDRAAHRRKEENSHLRALCDQGRFLVTDEELRDELQTAAASADIVDLDDEYNIRVSRLQETNAWLRGLLVRLHEHIEGREERDAVLVEEAIWRELIRSTERRHFESPV